MWFILWTTFAFAEEKRHRVANSTAIAHFFPAKSRTCPLGTETFHSTHCLADPEIYEGETYRMYTGASKGYRKKEHKDEQQDAQQHVKINANAEIAGAGGEEIEQNAEGGEVELEQETVKQGEKQEEERGEEDEKKIEGGGEKTKADTGQGGEGKTERVSAENEEKQTKDAQEDGGEGEGEGEKKETQNEDDLKDGAVGENEEKTEGEGDGEAKEGAEDEHVQDGAHAPDILQISCINIFYWLDGCVHLSEREDERYLPIIFNFLSAVYADRKPSKSTRPPLVMSPGKQDVRLSIFTIQNVYASCL